MAASEKAQVQAGDRALQQFIEHAPVALAMFDREMRYITASQRWFAEYGIPESEIRGRCHYDVFPEIPERWKQVHARALAGHTERSEEDPFVRSDGSVQWLRWEVRPWRNDAGNVAGIVLFTEDISERKQIESALAASEALYRTTTEIIPQLLTIHSPDGNLVWTNTQWRHYFGTSRIAAMRTEDFIHPEDRTAAMSAWLTALARKTAYEVQLRFRRRDGEYRWFRGHEKPLTKGDGDVESWIGSYTDVHDQIVLSRALAESEKVAKRRAEELNALVDSVPVFVFIAHDIECKLVTGSRAAYDLVGLPYGSNLSFAQDGPKPPFRPTKAGKTLSPIEMPLQRAAFGERVTGENFEMIFADGRRVSLFGNAAPVLDEHGKPRGAISAFADVTAAVRMEQELERRVRERTADIESFTYSMAHDLRAPLRAISSTSRIVLDEAGESLSEEYRHMLVRQTANSTKLARLIDDLLSLSGIGKVELALTGVDLTALAEEAIAPFKDSLCSFDIQPGLEAHADARLLKTALQNLIDNACKYSPAGGTIRVGARRDDSEMIYFVADEGIGLEMKYAEKIFKAFERLHRDEEYPGTGVGLASVQRVVERHGGRIWVESEGLGEGTTVCFTLAPNNAS